MPWSEELKMAHTHVRLVLAHDRLPQSEEDKARAEVMARLTGMKYYAGQRVKVSGKAKAVWTVLRCDGGDKYGGQQFIEVLSPKGHIQRWCISGVYETTVKIVEDAS